MGGAGIPEEVRGQVENTELAEDKRVGGPEEEEGRQARWGVPPAPPVLQRCRVHKLPQPPRL